MAEVLYPVAEVAKLWRCSVDHVYDLISAGQLRVVNLARGRAKTRVPESALSEYIRRNSRVAERSKRARTSTPSSETRRAAA